LHVNLVPEARGAQVGTRLVERFIEQVNASGGRMVEASVRSDNVAACHFFEQFGFAEVARQKLVLPKPMGYQVTGTVTYAKRW
jgi:ribosomal protein S18 acetylase RimI-like enzyme